MAGLDFPLLRNAAQRENEAPPRSEQTLRPGFAIAKAQPGKLWPKLLQGALGAHRRDDGHAGVLLEFCGISPVRTSLVGMVEARGGREKALAALARLGAAAH